MFLSGVLIRKMFQHFRVLKGKVCLDNKKKDNLLSVILTKDYRFKFKNYFYLNQFHNVKFR